MAPRTFREWLTTEIDRQGIGRRELARRLAAKHPEGVTPQTVETYRRAIYKYLDPDRTTRPTAPTRAAFAEALGVDPASVPSPDDDAEDRDLPLSREELALLADLMDRLKPTLDRVRSLEGAEA